MSRLSFTTLACPEWDIAQVIAAAVENGYGAIDFRGYRGTTDITQNDEFKGASLREIAARIADAGLEVSCLSSSAKMSSATDRIREDSLEMIRRYAELCHALGSRQVRIFGGATKDIGDPVANAAESLVAAASIARDAGITIAVETHDDWTDSSRLLQVFERAGWPEGAGFLWDVHHPYRFHGEAPGFTARNLSRRLVNTHWKDSAPTPGGTFAPCLSGEGDVPFGDLLKVLSEIGYDGWFTFEWEKKWHPEIPGPEIAIPQFARQMRALAHVCAC